MSVGDYEQVLALWNACEGVRANETKEELARILARNPGLSSVIRRGGELAAAVLCCHDGRRGYLYHLGVAPSVRQAGPRADARRAFGRPAERGGNQPLQHFFDRRQRQR